MCNRSEEHRIHFAVIDAYPSLHGFLVSNLTIGGMPLSCRGDTKFWRFGPFGEVGGSRNDSKIDKRAPGYFPEPGREEDHKR